MSLSYLITPSPIGCLLIAGDADAVTHMRRGSDAAELESTFRRDFPQARPQESDILFRAKTLVLNWLGGQTRDLPVPVRTDGTPFQSRVWDELRRIPYGQTCTYSELAGRIGKPAAFRAVANACGANPVPLVIPCHRIVHKHTGKTGFAWGPDIKHHLLAMEQNARATGRTARAVL